MHLNFKDSGQADTGECRPLGLRRYRPPSVSFSTCIEAHGAIICSRLMKNFKLLNGTMRDAVHCAL